MVDSSSAAEGREQSRAIRHTGFVDDPGAWLDDQGWLDDEYFDDPGPGSPGLDDGGLDARGPGGATVFDEPPTPAWVLDAADTALHEAVATAAHEPVGRDALTLLQVLDPLELADTARRAGLAAGDGSEKDPGPAGVVTGFEGATGPEGAAGSGHAPGSGHAAGRLAARTLVDAIVLAQRVVNHAQAVQQRFLAALCRPGVAVPLAELFELADNDLMQALAAAVDAGVPDASQPETDVADAAQPDAAQPDATQPDASQPETDVADAAQPETTQPETTQPDAAQPETTVPDTETGTASGRVASRAAAPAAPDVSRVLDHPVWSPALREAAIKAASAEVACALHLAPVTARLRCENATEFVDHLPATLAAQESGDVDGYRARVILDRVAVLAPERRHRVERRVLPRATSLTGAGFKRLIDREVIAEDPAAAEQRCEQSKERRDVMASRAEDGAGIFTAIVSAADAELAYQVLDAVGATLAAAKVSGNRTRPQVRADAFVDVFRSLADTGHATVPTPFGSGVVEPGVVAGAADQDSPGAAVVAGAADQDSPGAAVAGQPESRSSWCGAMLPAGRTGSAVTVRRPVALNVYLDAKTLAGLDDRPGELSGFGAITAETARALAASADTVRAIIVRPGEVNRTCGTVLDAGRAVYRPPDRTADYVSARDRTCCFPGCRMPARRCDLDRRRPFDSGGDTCPCNIDALCRTHHRLKTFTRWRAQYDFATGRLTWTSPLGGTYRNEQAHLLQDSPVPRITAPPAPTPATSAPAKSPPAQPAPAPGEAAQPASAPGEAAQPAPAPSGDDPLADAGDYDAPPF